MPKHCSFCKFAVVKPFRGEFLLEEDRLNDYTLLDRTQYVGPVRCKKKQWGVIVRSASLNKGKEKTVASTMFFTPKRNKLGHKAETCGFFDDMREDEDD